MAANREPAEAFHVGEHIRDELEARGWTLQQLAARMGGSTPRECGMDFLTVEFILFAADTQEINLTIDDETDAKLARAFDVTPGFFVNLDRAWREWMQRKSSY